MEVKAYCNFIETALQWVNFCPDCWNGLEADALVYEDYEMTCFMCKKIIGGSK